VWRGVICGNFIIGVKCGSGGKNEISSNENIHGKYEKTT